MRHPSSRDPKRARAFVVVSRQVLIDSKFSTVTCAPVYSRYHGLSTQVQLGTLEGLKHESAIHCDELISLPKASLTHYLGNLSSAKILQLNLALRQALDT
ncbi:type II toxin-antitoxin system PemK/MazF family toxin [Thiorhodovibrio litoralis]|uniref:type II toxin-antitoxin system PemK/MazF family toxin n=1 Tax=Thiorhodovibrio litoralis TaxID=2952932 RepID=UPI00389AF988